MVRKIAETELTYDLGNAEKSKDQSTLRTGESNCCCIGRQIQRRKEAADSLDYIAGAVDPKQRFAQRIPVCLSCCGMLARWQSPLQEWDERSG